MVPKEDWRLPGKGIGTFLLKSLSYRCAVSNATSKKCEYYCVLIFAHLLPCDVSVLFLQISLTLQSPKLPCHKWFVYKPQNIYCTKGCWWWQTECICAAASIWRQLLKVHPNIFSLGFCGQYIIVWVGSLVLSAKPKKYFIVWPWPNEVCTLILQRLPEAVSFLCRMIFTVQQGSWFVQVWHGHCCACLARVGVQLS